MVPRQGRERKDGDGSEAGPGDARRGELDMYGLAEEGWCREVGRQADRWESR
jgi:hypothetical protein